MAKLLLSLEGVALREVVLVKKRTTLGRRPYSDVVIDNLAVSGQHAALHLGADGELAIEDLRSTNGTFVNGARVERQVLRHGDIIGIGQYQLRFEHDARLPPADVAAAPAPAKAAAPAGVPAATEPEGGQPSLFAETALADEALATASRTPTIEVLSGAAAGRKLALHKVVTTIGKSGIGIAAITRRGRGFILSCVEGGAVPSINGAPLQSGPVALQNGDLLEMAGVRMQFRHALG
ncbi:FHA domain-containing protein [Xylophilus sp. ASV27]|uniref:FHA domain-containing protein n=1 Tax=Xylophilus sp. ASV27 TaxID=2795129 RepID=UPI0018EBBED6|nr:FHA domain-containing protein [Xylophilus sp. ASV27]